MLDFVCAQSFYMIICKRGQCVDAIPGNAPSYVAMRSVVVTSLSLAIAALFRRFCASVL